MLRGATGIWAPLLLLQKATNLAGGRSECSPLPTSSSTGSSLNVGSVCLWHPNDRGVYGHGGIWLSQEISQDFGAGAVQAAGWDSQLRHGRAASGTAADPGALAPTSPPAPGS